MHLPGQSLQSTHGHLPSQWTRARPRSIRDGQASQTSDEQVRPQSTGTRSAICEAQLGARGMHLAPVDNADQSKNEGLSDIHRSHHRTPDQTADTTWCWTCDLSPVDPHVCINKRTQLHASFGALICQTYLQHQQGLCSSSEENTARPDLRVQHYFKNILGDLCSLAIMISIMSARSRVGHMQGPVLRERQYPMASVMDRRPAPRCAPMWRGW